MLAAALCPRPKPKIVASFLSSFCAHGSALHHHQYGRFVSAAVPAPTGTRRLHSAACRSAFLSCDGGAASIWHAIVPSSSTSAGCRRRRRFELVKKGEGSWNASLDARPARWLHRADSAWLLFGVCACACLVPAPIEEAPQPELNSGEEELPLSDEDFDESADYTVTEFKESPWMRRQESAVVQARSSLSGVLADGRCLFRAIAHVASLRNGEEAPDETRQRELADELRAQVVDELLKRREESEWFIEGDFDAYVDRIRKPCVWGGEPELIMASHVLKTQIYVFMRDRSTGALTNIAKYGEEYGNEDEENDPINVLFHGYGHYDILETPMNKIKA